MSVISPNVDDRLRASPVLEQSEAVSGSNHALWLVVLIAFALVASFAGLGSGPRLGDHECIVAQVARQMRQNGEWIIPKLGEIERVRKTPLGYWSVALSSWVVDGPGVSLPVTDLSARLPSAMAGFLTTLVVYWLGRMMYGRAGGLITGFIWAGSAGAILFSRNAQVDMILTLFTTLSMALFWRGAIHSPRSKPAMAAFYVAFALAMMAKAPLPGATVGVALAIFWLATMPLLVALEETVGDRKMVLQVALRRGKEQFKRLPLLWIFPGTILWLAIIVPWPFYAWLKVPGALSLWKLEYINRMSGYGERDPAWFYIPVLFAFMGPYLLSLAEGVGAVFLSRYRQYRLPLAFAFTWGVWSVVFLSTSSEKKWHYVLSVMPAFCLMVAPVIERLFLGPRGQLSDRLVQAACAVLPVGIAGGFIAAGVFVHRQAPGLLPVYIVIALLLTIAWTISCRFFAADRRVAALGALNIGVLVLACLAWPIAGLHFNSTADAKQMAAQFKALGIQPHDAIYIVGSRPNAAYEFYYGYRVQRLIDENEMARMRPSRRTIDEDLLKKLGVAVEEKLREPKPVYLMMASLYYELFKQNHRDVGTKLLYEESVTGRKKGTQTVLFTQASTATQPTR